jgi:hypothetical protein
VRQWHCILHQLSQQPPPPPLHKHAPREGVVLHSGLKAAAAAAATAVAVVVVVVAAAARCYAPAAVLRHACICSTCSYTHLRTCTSTTAHAHTHSMFADPFTQLPTLIQQHRHTKTYVLQPFLPCQCVHSAQHLTPGTHPLLCLGLCSSSHCCCAAAGRRWCSVFHRPARTMYKVATRKHSVILPWLTLLLCSSRAPFVQRMPPPCKHHVQRHKSRHVQLQRSAPSK